MTYRPMTTREMLRRPMTQREGAERLLQIGEDLVSLLKEVDHAFDRMPADLVDVWNAIPGTYDIDTVAKAIMAAGRAACDACDAAEERATEEAQRNLGGYR